MATKFDEDDFIERRRLMIRIIILFKNNIL